VRVTDFGELDDGTKYLVMQMLEGRELKAQLGAAWAPAEAIDSTLQILAGLDHAHQHGVVHRDLKPENVFVTQDHTGARQLKLVDFGIAKILDDQGTDAKLTRTGMVFGTPRYMSPEQAAGGKIDARTDLYAVGLILYEMLAGKPPFEAEDTAALFRMHILQPPPALPDTLPESLRNVVMRLLEKSRMDRFPDAKEAMQALRAAREDVMAGITGPPSVAAAVAVAVVGAAAPIGTGTAPPAFGTEPSPVTAGPGVTHSTGPSVVPVMHPGVTHPSYGPAPTMAPTMAPRRSNALPWAIAGGAVLLLLLLLFGVGVALSGDDADPDETDAAALDPAGSETGPDAAADANADAGDEKADKPKKKPKKPKKDDKKSEEQAAVEEIADLMEGKGNGKGNGKSKGKGKGKKKHH
jgi:hypothetical protein